MNGPPGGPRLAVLTSGGDAQGMNPAVRAVVRTALTTGRDLRRPRGLAGAGRRRRPHPPVAWDDVSNILNRGGTVIGTARSAAFRQREGRRRAAQHLLERASTGWS